jgi:hypothetical protein
MESSWRSRGSEAKDGRFDGVRCGAVEVRPNYPSLDGIFLLAHRGILVIWSSTPLALGLHFARCGLCASCPREERREVRDLPDLRKSERMFVWFLHLVDSSFASIHPCV